MRGHRLIVAAGLFALASVAAQPASAQTRFGLRAGMNFATLSGDDVGDEGFDTRMGLLAGGFLEVPIAEIVNVHLGAQYSQKGTAVEAIGGEEAEIELDYFEVPALLAVSVPGTSSIDFRLYVGPTFSFLVKCEGEAFGFSADCDDDDFESFDVGGEVGAGISLGMGNGAAFLLDGFYNFGFGSIDGSGDDTDIKNDVFSVSAGIIFAAGE